MDTAHRAKMIYDEQGVDIGDWLPQDEEHYNRVGPHCLKGADGKYHEADWATWWANPESKVENWVSYGMVLEKKCDCCGNWSDAGASLWGLDSLVWQGVYEGTFTREELVKMDEYLGEVFDELVEEAE